jgi:hypothetical protein
MPSVYLDRICSSSFGICCHRWARKLVIWLLSDLSDNDKGKGKGHPRTCHEGPEAEYRYCSIITLTSSLDGAGGQRHALADLNPRKTRYPLYTRLGGPHGRSGVVRKDLCNNIEIKSKLYYSKFRTCAQDSQFNLLIVVCTVMSVTEMGRYNNSSFLQRR